MGEDISILDKLKAYLIKHKKFIKVIKNDKQEPEYWRGYEDAIEAFSFQIDRYFKDDDRHRK